MTPGSESARGHAGDFSPAGPPAGVQGPGRDRQVRLGQCNLTRTGRRHTQVSWRIESERLTYTGPADLYG